MTTESLAQVWGQNSLAAKSDLHLPPPKTGRAWEKGGKTKIATRLASALETREVAAHCPTDCTPLFFSNEHA